MESQEQAMRRTSRQQRRRRFNGALAGGIAGIVATAVSAAFTRQSIEWHSFVLEGVFSTVAGYVLARIGGGILPGILLFTTAYWAAFFTRAGGFDPSVIFGAADLRAAAAGQGHLMTLSMLVAIGGLFGHQIEG